MGAVSEAGPARVVVGKLVKLLRPGDMESSTVVAEEEAIGSAREAGVARMLTVDTVLEVERPGSDDVSTLTLDMSLSRKEVDDEVTAVVSHEEVIELSEEERLNVSSICAVDEIRGLKVSIWDSGVLLVVESHEGVARTVETVSCSCEEAAYSLLVLSDVVAWLDSEMETPLALGFASVLESGVDEVPLCPLLVMLLEVLAGGGELFDGEGGSDRD